MVQYPTLIALGNWACQRLTGYSRSFPLAPALNAYRTKSVRAAILSVKSLQQVSPASVLPNFQSLLPHCLLAAEMSILIKDDPPASSNQPEQRFAILKHQGCSSFSDARPSIQISDFYTKLGSSSRYVGALRFQRSICHAPKHHLIKTFRKRA